MSAPHYVIATPRGHDCGDPRCPKPDVVPSWAPLAPVLDLPDAEHIHVTRHPDRTLSAVPMEASDGFERFVTTDEAPGEKYVGFRALTGLWVDSPGCAAPQDEYPPVDQSGLPL